MSNLLAAGRVILALVVLFSITSCRPQASESIVNTPVTTPAGLRPVVLDYTQPHAVLDLFYQLVLSRRWEDAYSLLSRDSKAVTKLGDFVQGWASQDGRLQLLKVERLGAEQVSEREASFFCQASWEQAYPKPGKFQSFFVRSLVKEEKAWRLRWRGPERQLDLGREYPINQSQESHSVACELERVVVMESSTLVFVRFVNRSTDTLQIDPDLAELALLNGRSVPLETKKEGKLPPRGFAPGQERKDVVIFRALEPGVARLTFVSPQLSFGSEKWSYSFSVQME